MKKIPALIVQGYPEIRAALRDLVATEKDLLLVGECTDGASAVTAIRKHRPQLLFLGVQLRGLNGFELLKFLDGEVPPAVIFVSYFDHAAGAFGVHAVDYLLKPFTRQRFKQAVQRARVRLESVRNAHQPVKTPLTTRFAKPISVREGGRIVLIKPHEIVAVVAQRNYSALHTTDSIHRTRLSLGEVQARLGTEKFLRINRSTLVNTRRIKEIVRKSHGDALLRIESGEEFRLSRRYRTQWAGLVDTKAEAT